MTRDLARRLPQARRRLHFAEVLAIHYVSHLRLTDRKRAAKVLTQADAFMAQGDGLPRAIARAVRLIERKRFGSLESKLSQACKPFAQDDETVLKFWHEEASSDAQLTRVT
jgi:hypothetical protein